MQSRNLAKTGIVVIAIMLAGGFLGMWFGDSLRGSIFGNLGDERMADPVERYELGRDSFNKGRVKVDPSHNIPMRNEATEFGIVRNGARVLVPYEPARAKERADNMAAQQWQDYQFPDIENRDDFHYYDTASGSGSSRHNAAEARTAALNRQQAAIAADNAGQ